MTTRSGTDHAITNGSHTDATPPTNGMTTSGDSNTGTARDARWGLPLVVLVAGTFMTFLDISIVNVAIPTIQNEFGVATDDVQWVATAYALALGVVVPTSAWLGERFGLNRVYGVALLGFAAGSALCGLAWNLGSLVTFRIIQAIPGAVLPVITLTMLYRIVPRYRIGVAMGFYALGIICAPAMGPTLGGYLVEYVDWRLIFFANVPVGILAAVAAVLVLPRFPGQPGRRFDVLGFLTSGGGLFALLLALSKGQSWGWDSYRILSLFIGGALCLALFAAIELEVTNPLLDLRVFRFWPFVHSLLLTAAVSVVLNGLLFYIPLFLQHAQGWGALDAGLALLPQALMMGVLLPISGALYDRIGARWPVAIGLAIAAGATYQMHVMNLDTTREQVMWWFVWVSSGLGLAIMPIITAGLATIPAAQVGGASVVNNVVRYIAAALGIAVLTAIWTTQQAQQLSGRIALVPGAPSTGTAAAYLEPEGSTTQLLYAYYQQTQLHVFVSAMDDLILIAAALSALGAVGALWMRSGRPSASPPQALTAPQEPAMASSNGNGAVKTITGSAPNLTSPGQPRPDSDGDPDPAGETATELLRH